MKYKKILMSFFFCAQCFAVKVPDCWLNSELCSDSQKARPALQYDLENNEIDKELDKILDVKSDIVENKNNTPSVAKEGFYLQSIKSEIAVEAGGEIGILGGGGEAAVELIWIRNLAQSKLPMNKLLEDETNFDSNLTLNDLDDLSSLNSTLLSIGQGLEKNGRLHDKDKFKLLASNEIKKLLPLINALQEVQDKTWAPYKLQLELKFESSGELAVGAALGGGFRLRLEWNINKIQHNSALKKQNANLIKAICDDFSLMNATMPDDHFQMNNIKIGFGVGAEGNIYFLKAKGHAIASVFFKRQKNSEKSQSTQIELDSYPMSVASESILLKSNSLEQIQISREKFKDGLERLMNTAASFSKAARRREEKILKRGHTPQFNLNFIEIETEIFASGSLGLASLEGISVAEFFFEKIK